MKQKYKIGERTSKKENLLYVYNYKNTPILSVLLYGMRSENNLMYYSDIEEINEDV